MDINEIIDKLVAMFPSMKDDFILRVITCDFVYKLRQRIAINCVNLYEFITLFFEDNGKDMSVKYYCQIYYEFFTCLSLMVTPDTYEISIDNVVEYMGYEGDTENLIKFLKCLKCLSHLLGEDKHRKKTFMFDMCCKLEGKYYRCPKSDEYIIRSKLVDIEVGTTRDKFIITGTSIVFDKSDFKVVNEKNILEEFDSDTKG